MFYVYLLKSPKTDQIYVGFTTDLKRRFAEHQKLQRHKGWRLVYYEAYRNQEDAASKTQFNSSGFRMGWVTACLLHNESASYCQWPA